VPAEEVEKICAVFFVVTPKVTGMIMEVAGSELSKKELRKRTELHDQNEK